MKRRYTREKALANIERLREAFSGANFTTDLMVGFPGESEEDFLLTADFVTRAGFIDAHVFAYSKRERTPAADYDGQIPEDVKKDRSKRLIRHKNEIRDSLLSEVCKKGEPLLAIAESLDGDGRLNMHSESFIEIKTVSAFDEDCLSSLVGRWMRVKPVSHKNGILNCEII